MGSLLQLIGEGSDQQIATEPARRFGAIQLPLGKPQFVRRPIHQFGNLPVHLGDVRIARSVSPVAASARRSIAITPSCFDGRLVLDCGSGSGKASIAGHS